MSAVPDGSGALTLLLGAGVIALTAGLHLFMALFPGRRERRLFLSPPGGLLRRLMAGDLPLSQALLLTLLLGVLGGSASALLLAWNFSQAGTALQWGGLGLLGAGILNTVRRCPRLVPGTRLLTALVLSLLWVWLVLMPLLLAPV